METSESVCNESDTPRRSPFVEDKFALRERRPVSGYRTLKLKTIMT
jgi:hypothetical protein